MTPQLNDILDTLIQTLDSQGRLILEAPPGAGKTTRVPLALLKSPLSDKKILMLEPRRLAARSSARYMASLLGETVGQRVGYRVRLDSKIGPQTRIEVVTEGVLTRLIQADPELSDYGVVIFDEFHERSLQADLGLALALQVQEVLREDLKLLIMSATLSSEQLSEQLGAPVLSVAGRQFPVTCRYAPPADPKRWLNSVPEVILSTLDSESGSILVFLPGMGEIQRCHDALKNTLPEDVILAPLFGKLTAKEQDLAIQPAPHGLRKVVLATNLAETSLTIEGIRIVIDSGYERAPFFDPRSGLTRLITRSISEASTIQRMGRAGRLSEGLCIRLWPESEQRMRVAETPPEITDADLSALVLELATWGTYDPSELTWVTPPPTRAFEEARSLLISLEALTPEGRLTPHGQALAKLPLHPRLAHMILKSQMHQMQDLTGLACVLAALLSERDILSRQRGVDLKDRVKALKKMPTHHVYKQAQDLAQRAKCTVQFGPLDSLGFLVGLAYPDRIAQRRKGSASRYLLAQGKGALVDEMDALGESPWLAVAHLDGREREARVHLAAELTPDDLALLTEGQTYEETQVETDKRGKIRARILTKYGKVTLSERLSHELTPEMVKQGLLASLKNEGLPWSEALRAWQDRVLYLTETGLPWPDMSDQALLADLESWLGPFLEGLTHAHQVNEGILKQALEFALGYENLAQLDILAPSHFQVPSGSRIRIDYAQRPPVLAARIQEMFGLQELPTVREGKEALMVHLLSPARRPVQVTQDLPRFWAVGYQEVKKELKGRYPRHYWPDDPLQAEAIRGIKRPKK